MKPTMKQLMNPQEFAVMHCRFTDSEKWGVIIRVDGHNMMHKDDIDTEAEARAIRDEIMEMAIEEWGSAAPTKIINMSGMPSLTLSEAGDIIDAAHKPKQ